jgi:hypothetical protein
MRVAMRASLGNARPVVDAAFSPTCLVGYPPAVRALRVYTERDYPRDCVGTQRTIWPPLWSDLPRGDRSANLHHAIACYEAALHVFTEREFPQNGAMTKNNLLRIPAM